MKIYPLCSRIVVLLRLAQDKQLRPLSRANVKFLNNIFISQCLFGSHRRNSLTGLLYVGTGIIKIMETKSNWPTQENSQQKGYEEILNEIEKIISSPEELKNWTEKRLADLKKLKSIVNELVSQW